MPLEDLRPLDEHDALAQPGEAELAQVDASDLEPPPARLAHPGQHLPEQRLAGARRPSDGDALARAEGERDLAQRLGSARFEGVERDPAEFDLEGAAIPEGFASFALGGQVDEVAELVGGREQVVPGFEVFSRLRDAFEHRR